MDPPRTITIGISGCSSSGKTTLARLLRDMFPETFILHEDDFYKTDSELPIKNGLVDWDCPEAISIPDLEDALAHIHATGTFPPTLDSKEDLNSVGPSPASPSHIAACTARVQNWLSPGQPGSLIFPSNLTSSSPSPSSPQPPQPKKTKVRLCLLDGFLLYSPPHFSRVMSLLDVKLFLRVSKAKAVARREARDGYVTLEGFWKDPPGYVEQIVWPNHVEAHRWMFRGGEVEEEGGGSGGGGGELDWEAVRREGISVMDGGADREFGEVLEWAVGIVMGKMERIVLGGQGEGKGRVEG
ncbi:P-loop containing nucleoside triphosphate hydrolase protein [Parathielavia hyrcaniae]|uniref:P-loop containing nucleoside triphosphate hydrolase protein n=1 Tax=Parathielavia hyrcaniae TaxID=113614 RepID=A0AAN6T2A2_9PEZI|nr:P-loop containing nucleoside triphosphate hydrolase protein [Parathielavia hyrcaniae]